MPTRLPSASILASRRRESVDGKFSLLFLFIFIQHRIGFHFKRIYIVFMQTELHYEAKINVVESSVWSKIHAQRRSSAFAKSFMASLSMKHKIFFHLPFNSVRLFSFNILHMWIVDVRFSSHVLCMNNTHRTDRGEEARVKKLWKYQDLNFNEKLLMENFSKMCVEEERRERLDEWWSSHVWKNFKKIFSNYFPIFHDYACRIQKKGGLMNPLMVLMTWMSCQWLLFQQFCDVSMGRWINKVAHTRVAWVILLCVCSLHILQETHFVIEKS